MEYKYTVNGIYKYTVNGIYKHTVTKLYLFRPMKGRDSPNLVLLSPNRKIHIVEPSIPFESDLDSARTRKSNH